MKTVSCDTAVGRACVAPSEHGSDGMWRGIRGGSLAKRGYFDAAGWAMGRLAA